MMGHGCQARSKDRPLHLCLNDRSFHKRRILRPEHFHSWIWWKTTAQPCKPYLSNAGQDTSSLISEPSLLPVTEKTSSNSDDLWRDKLLYIKQILYTYIYVCVCFTKWNATRQSGALCLTAAGTVALHHTVVQQVARSSVGEGSTFKLHCVHLVNKTRR